VIFAVPRETREGETRVSVLPQTVEKLVELGAEVLVETGLGASCRLADADYTKAGARIVPDANTLIEQADVVLRLNKPEIDEIDRVKENAIHISYLDPFNEKELVTALGEKQVRAISMELIPRSTRAQKMDALSSQASLAGYVAVIVAAEHLDSVFPMMTTPAGTIYPARVFIIGAGVAGLQAIATAKRLGARVEAFDTRPVVAEQVESLGARFVKVDLGEQGETKDGYAKELTPEQLEKQRQVMAQHCAAADVVITTAQVFGRKAPLIVTEDMVSGMKPGSVVIDMAVETGGNVAGSVAGEEVEMNGVRLIGITNLAGRVPLHASQMYSSNLLSFITEFWDAESKTLVIDPEDEIIAGCLVTTGGSIVNERLKEIYS
jgi:H+-translocating NAD(P) transhydrogenase subunit alpha